MIEATFFVCIATLCALVVIIPCMAIVEGVLEIVRGRK